MKRQKKIIIIIVVFLIAGAGVAVYTFMSQNHTKQVPQDTSSGSSTTPQEDTNACIQDWYEKHPETKPENQKPGTIYLAPPCPGVPQ